MKCMQTGIIGTVLEGWGLHPKKKYKTQQMKSSGMNGFPKRL